VFQKKDLAEDSMFPFKIETSIELKIVSKWDKKLIIEKWEETPQEETG